MHEEKEFQRSAFGLGPLRFSCFLPGPGIGFQDLRQAGMGVDLVAVHYAANGFSDLREIDLSVDKSFDGDFVNGVQDGWHGAADFACFPGQPQGWEALLVRFLKS